MNITELFSNLSVDDSNVDLILTSQITDPSKYVKALKVGLISVDTIVDINLRIKALSVITNSCIELYKWFLPYTEGILSKDYQSIKDKYLDYTQDIHQMVRSLVELCDDFTRASPTRKCSIAKISRCILSELTPKLDAWAGWERD